MPRLMPLRPARGRAVSWTSRSLALLGGAVLAVAVPALPALATTAALSGASTAGPPASTGIVKGHDELRLLSQSSWVGPGPGDFRLHLAVTASDPAGEGLELIVYDALTARSAFDAAVDGYVSGAPQYDPSPVPLGTLHPDPGGGVDLDIPVDQPSEGLALTGTGVYPVQVFLEEGGARMGQPLITFLVYVDKFAGELKKLQAAVVVPFSSYLPVGRHGALGPVPSRVAAELTQDASDLASSNVPVTLKADVSTLEAMATGGPAERAAVAGLRQAVAGGDELLPGTALQVSFSALVRSGLQADLKTEIVSGSDDLEKLMGAGPSLTTWAFTANIDPRTVSAVAAVGAEQVVLPEPDLSALPLADQKLTFAQPAKLDLSGAQIEVVGADSELSARISEASTSSDPALLANQVLAELVMIDLETPSYIRGVVVEPFPGVTVAPGFLSVLMVGLQGNPLVQATTVEQLFDDVPVATSGKAPLVRTVQPARSSIAPLAGVEELAQAQRAISADAAVYTRLQGLVGALQQRLLVSLSSVYSARLRASLIAGVLRDADDELAMLRLPPETSITLTSDQGRLPLRVVSTSGSPARVLLVLTSEQLSFIAVSFPQGRCVPLSPGLEDCELTLSEPSTTLEVPVVARARGTSPLSLAMSTPDGSVVFAHSSLMVRSTAISQVGLVLMAGAVLFLAVWWARNARHGRRALRLVPKDDEVAGQWSGARRTSRSHGGRRPPASTGSGAAGKGHGPRSRPAAAGAALAGNEERASGGLSGQAPR
jgi:hypothetical protein